MPRKLLILALALPLVVIALGIGRAELQLAHSQRWLFDVEGYDPRDLLRGRYINYRVRFAPASNAASAEHTAAVGESCVDSDPTCCLCLRAQQAGEPPTTQRMSCEAATSCDGRLQTRYLAELRRYYIPEAGAGKLDARFREAVDRGRARAQVVIDPRGQPRVEALLIDGQRIESVR